MSEMATLQEKNPKMDPKKRFFLKNPPGFWTFEKSSSKLTSNRPFWLKQIYRDIKFILRGLPGRCEIAGWISILTTCVQNHIIKWLCAIIFSNTNWIQIAIGNKPRLFVRFFFLAQTIRRKKSWSFVVLLCSIGAKRTWKTSIVCYF